MELKELLESLELTDDQVKGVLDGMKANRLYVTGEENIEERYGKLKGQHQQAADQLKEAQTLIEFDYQSECLCSKTTVRQLARQRLEGDCREGVKRAGVEYNDGNIMEHVSVYSEKNTYETLAEALSCEDESNAVCNEIKKATQELLKSEGLI